MERAGEVGGAGWRGASSGGAAVGQREEELEVLLQPVTDSRTHTGPYYVPRQADR